MEMKTFLKFLIWPSLGLFLLSCVGPGERTSMPLQAKVPSKWTAAQSLPGPVRTEWWKDFKDPELNALVEEALQHNQDIQGAAARVRAACAMAKMAGADFLPNVNLGTSAARARSSVMGEPTTGNQFQLSLNIGWEIDLWGRLRAGQRAAVKEFEAAKAQYAGARLSIVAQTVKARFAVIEARRQVALARTTVENYRKSLNIVEDRFHRGVSPSLDVRLASANLASAEALLHGRREQFDRAVRRLEILLGRYPKRELGIPADLPAMPPHVPAGLPSELLKRRPDLAVARHRVLAADARLFGAKASLLPRLSLTSSGGAASGELGDLFKGSSLIWQLAGNLLQPIFQGGKLHAHVDLQKSRMEEAIAAYQVAALQAFKDVETALAAEKFLSGRSDRLEAAALHATEARLQAESRYQSGIAGFLHVLDAQKRELDARSRWLTVRRERLDNRVNLHLALGGGF
jgi:NodT family efflux transporter outer membrane factor (OMF) lipoprotein